MEPGDVVTTDEGRRFKIGQLMAYQGKADCQSPRCTRMNFGSGADGLGTCMGWHCPTCHAPTSSYGHKCPERGEV